MTTSNNTIKQYTRDEIITAALRKLGVIAKGQTPDATDLTNGSMALNMLVAELRAMGMPLWARKTHTFNFTASTSLYQIGVGKTINVPYPLHLLQAYRKNSDGTNRVDMEIVGDSNFNLLPTGSGGTPIKAAYQPFVNYGEIRVWPTPTASDTSSTITVVYQSPFQYFDATADTMDFPEEWYNPIVYSLANNLAPEWGVSIEERQMLQSQTQMHMQTVLQFGQEDASLFVKPSRRM